MSPAGCVYAGPPPLPLNCPPPPPPRLPVCVQDPAEASDVQNVLGVMYSSISFLGMSNCMAVMPVAGMERVVSHQGGVSNCMAVMPVAGMERVVSHQGGVSNCMAVMPVAGMERVVSHQGGVSNTNHGAWLACSTAVYAQTGAGWCILCRCVV